MSGQSQAGQYVEWVASQPIQGATVTVDGLRVTFSTPGAIGTVEVYELEMDVVAMSVTDPSGEDTKFFLHFELDDLDHAKEVFASFVESMEASAGERRMRVLLTCTSAFTTSFFANKLAEAAQMMGYPMDFAAVPFPQLYEEAVNYDVILLAPQVAYHKREVAQALPNKFVDCIPTASFANYDVGSVIDWLRDEQRAWRARREERELQEAREQIRNSARVLVLTILPDGESINIYNRIYRSGRIEHCEKVVIPRKDAGWQRLSEVLAGIAKVTPCLSDKVDVVGVAIPGIINDGVWVIDGHGERAEANLSSIISERTGLPTVVTNNVNAAAFGYLHQHDCKKNLVFMSHSFGNSIGGQGIVVDGRVITGAHGGAGELKYLLREISANHGWTSHDYYDPQCMLKVISTSLRASIAIVDPPLICVRCPLVSDMDILRDELAGYIPEQDIPELQFVGEDEMLEYTMLGQMHLCLDELEAARG